MIYGEFGSLESSVIEEICGKGIPIIIHRRNVARPIYICSPFRPELQETVTSQILARENERKRRAIAKRLLKARFETMRWLIPPPRVRLSTSMTLEEMRRIEARHSKAYWLEYYKRLGYSNTSRRGRGQIALALNALSKFLSGILLRWITYHHLSPFHGYLHVQADYPALIYDLMEPYRAYFERMAFECFGSVEDPNNEPLVTGMVINRAKDYLDEDVYTGLTRQIVSRQELLHGIVLSLKSYLLREQREFLIPLIDKPNGGRPKKVSFRLYGRQAGRTDFWKEARRISSPSSGQL
jgi:CRISPR/Cas system-associated endonuclease Cas1